MNHRTTEGPRSNSFDLSKTEAVCVIFRNKGGVGVICYDADNRSSLGARIRTYLPGRVDDRWDGPLLQTAAEVFTHLGQSEEPCSVPVSLARSLFNWPLPLANLPDYGDDSTNPGEQ